jgi:integration host factor subunit alpha
MATMTRADFAENIRRAFGLTLADSYKLIDVFFSEISESLVRGEEVKVAGLGTFKILEKSARPGRNPKTGEPKIITARRVVSFRPSTEFRKKVRGTTPTA